MCSQSLPYPVNNNIDLSRYIYIYICIYSYVCAYIYMRRVLCLFSLCVYTSARLRLARFLERSCDRGKAIMPWSMSSTIAVLTSVHRKHNVVCSTWPTIPTNIHMYIYIYTYVYVPTHLHIHIDMYIHIDMCQTFADQST